MVMTWWYSVPSVVQYKIWLPRQQLANTNYTPLCVIIELASDPTRCASSKIGAVVPKDNLSTRYA